MMVHEPGLNNLSWYAVRRVFYDNAGTYEERLTLWFASDFAKALELSEEEAADYTEETAMEDLGMAQAFSIDALPLPLAPGTEIFSLMRDSDLDPDTYIQQFFQTGAERER